jgi:hypothetical protein
MRELTNEEKDQVSGGYAGWKIPFGGNSFLPGQPAKLYPSNAVLAAGFALKEGWDFGQRINQFNQEQFGMSLGVAIYRTFNGGSNVGGGGTTIEHRITIEEV